MSAIEKPLVPGDFEGVDGPLQVAVAGEPAPIALAIESVTPLPSHRYREAPFSVVLKGPSSPALAQGIYPLEHPRLGTLQLFMVPIARDGSFSRYELTFN